ncbi:MAG: carboxypeptidase-like regulatory domain-containing protein [Candidatus Woesebacteria bacterium]|jgi:hypothetical protein
MNNKLRIKLVHKGKPLKGARVELHSEPKTGITNDEGEIIFDQVEAGTHSLKISYNDYEIEQKINVEGEEREFDLLINLEMKSKSFPLWMLVIIVFILIIPLYIYFLKRNY